MAATTASANAVWSFGLGGMEEDESEDFMCQKVVEEPTEETLDEEDEPHEASEGSLDMESASKPASASAVWAFGLGGQEQDDDDDEEDDAWGAAVAPPPPASTPPSSPPSPPEAELEESMEFVPISSQVSPASPAAFAINEDEEVTDEGAFLSPVTPPKKSVGKVMRHPHTVGSLRRPLGYAATMGRERMTPGSLLSKMTPKGAFKRASDIAAISVNKKSEDKLSRAERLMSIQSSFRHLDLNDSSSSLPMMAAPDLNASIRTDLNASTRIDESEELQEEEEEHEASEHRDSDTSAILPSLPMNSSEGDWESSRRTITENSDPSTELGVPAPPAPPEEEDESPGTITSKKKKKSKSKSPKLASRKTKKLVDDEASPSTKKKKKKGIKKALKMATAPAVAMTELVRDTSNGMTEMVKSAAEGVSSRTSEIGDIIKDKKKKKKKDVGDDATATSKKKKKQKASKSLSPVPLTQKKKKSKRKLVDGRKGLPTATERPISMSKPDSFSSNHSAQSCQSFS